MSQTANWLVPPPGANAVGGAAAAEGTIIPSASYGTGTLNTAEIANPTAKGVRLFINVTNVGAAGTLTVAIQSKDPVSSNWVNSPDGAITPSIVATGTTTLTVYPGLAETTNVEISDHLDIAWRVQAVVGANAVSFSVGGTYLS